MLISLIMNPFIVENFLSGDKNIESSLLKIIIILFELVGFILGAHIYLNKFNLLNKKNFKKNLLLFTITLIMCFLILEIIIRIFGQYDIDGQFKFMKYDIRPFTLPNNLLIEKINGFNDLKQHYIIPNNLLGWTIGNSSRSSNELYESNSIGIRNPKEFKINKNNNAIRIELFGDSFIHGDDVSFNETWGYYLEKSLSESLNKTVEVMNFGVGGYGNDQAYLRWKLLGQNYDPNIIIIGFQAENCKRNLNIVRKFYLRETGILFSKPRFVLLDNSLNLVNYPTINYEEIPSFVKNFESTNLSKYEYYYNNKDYSKKNILYKSKVISLLISIYYDLIAQNKEIQFYKEGSSESILCYEIIKKFVKEASNNSTVYLIHLITETDIQRQLNDQEFIYEPLLNKIKKEFNIIDPSDSLIEEAKKTSLETLFKGHYTAKGNKIVSDSAHNFILPFINQSIK